MDIFSVFTLFGGLALFLYGMNLMGDGLAKTAGGKLERILEKLTSTPIKGVLLGAAVTAVIQSSSATTVMVVGFVNSGIMKLSQAASIIMGANVGTTFTSWILSLSGVESENFWIKLLKPSSFSPVLAVIGIILLLFVKNPKKKDIGTILIGFAILMFGMESMSEAVKPLAEVEEFTRILTMFSNPILGMLAGMTLTAVIQSSSASVGILQALCVTGSVSYGSAIPIIMGQNIGTCVTALMSSIGAKKNAKRAAFIHLYFNVIGTALFMALFYGIHAIHPFAFLGDSVNGADIAVIHSIFNVIATFSLLPFTKYLVKLASYTVKNDLKEDDETAIQELNMLDNRFLEKPSFAVAQSVTVTRKMADISKKTMVEALSLLDQYEEDKLQEVIALETMVDQFDDKIGAYLVKLSSKDLSVDDTHTVSLILQCIGEFERISDHAINICEAIQEINKNEQGLSERARYEMETYKKALLEILDKAEIAFKNKDLSLAATIEPLEQTIDDLTAMIKKAHVKRLRRGECSIEMGIFFEDLLINFERVADHCSNIALNILQLQWEEFEAHEYLQILKRENNKKFIEEYEQYKVKYQLKA